jgi:hypothetical protein
LPSSLRDLLRGLAAIAIQQDASQAQIPPGDFDPLIVEAIHAGALQAAALTAAGVRLRAVEEDLPLIPTAPDLAERPAEIAGPFLRQAVAERFVFFQSSTFLSVLLRRPVITEQDELLILIPSASQPSADDRTWTLPAGSVWIQARFLVAHAADFAGLRIAGGTLTFDQPALVDGGIFIGFGTGWTLSVQLEQPAPGAAGDSDADALNLRMPTQLDIHLNAPPVISGNASFSGFGSDLNFTPSGAAFADGNQICFPLQAAEPLWSIDGNRSRVAQFSGASAPGSPRWAIPTSDTLPSQLGEANHGGSIVISLADGLTCAFAAQQGSQFRCFDATLTANATRLEVRSLKPGSGGSYDLHLWNTSVSQLRFANSVAPLTFRSERGGFDIATFFGGVCTNKWDLPRQANGAPVPFQGDLDHFGLFTTPGNLVAILDASPPAPTELSGLALENLYLVVRMPTRFALNAAFEAAPQLPSGNAYLFFEVDAAIPALPDPYASNLEVPDPKAQESGSLLMALVWTNSGTPALAAQFEEQVPFPPAAINVPADQDEIAVYGAFQAHLQSKAEPVYLLDLSSREDLFGVAFESPSDISPQLQDNRLSVQLNQIRLLMQPQVQWEPVQNEPNPDVPGVNLLHSGPVSGPTLVGANSVKLVPVLPGPLSDEILGAIGAGSPAAALFSLPFGLRAFANLDLEPLVIFDGPQVIFPQATDTAFNEPAFDPLTSARQLRLIARKRPPQGEDTGPVMPGMLRQLKNLANNNSGLTSVLPPGLSDFNNQFAGGVPLLQADLSGYGLSAFSEWHVQEAIEGLDLTKVEFRVLNGRTAYEVVQVRSILYECGARVVRTVILERGNSGRVNRLDTGWVAVDAGQFARPQAFEKGAVQAFENIRRIRITGAAFNLDADTAVEPVLFDADASIDGALAGPVPIYDRPGYVLVKAPPPDPAGGGLGNQLSPTQLMILFQKVHAIGSPVNCAVRIGDTLEAQVSSIVSDVALDDFGDIGFAVAVVGAPKLPRAGQWSVVRIDPSTLETSPVDQRRGVPFVRNGDGGPFRFREPADTRLKTAKVEYALLMSTETSRALFQQARIEPSQTGTLLFDVPPFLADPYSLVQAGGPLPRPNFGLGMKELPALQISAENLWSIENPVFTPADAKPAADFMKGGGWGLARDYVAGTINLGIDSGNPVPFNVTVPPALLNLNLSQLPSPLGDVLQISANYENVAGQTPKMLDPKLVFQGALEELTETLDALASITGLPFHFDVGVTAASGGGPPFAVHLSLLFCIGLGPDHRAEIGLGKFYGQFLVQGELEVTPTGVDGAQLLIDFQGDVQQGILPPLLYAGGLFRFNVELRQTGAPIIQITLGIVISIGGDLIPGLLSLEATMKYGYSLIPLTLEPGILLGVEARASLLAGLIGFSFSAEVMARIKRKDRGQVVTITAQLHIAATVHVAIFLDEDVHLDTQFHQDIPLATVGLLPGVGLVVAPALIPL